MAELVLSIPASGTIKLINNYMVHAFPHPRSYKLDNYVTFREKGSFMERMFTLQNTVVFNPFNDEIEEAIKYLEEEDKVRIISYVSNRKKAFGFNTPNNPYMFWILKLHQILNHTPRPMDTVAMSIFHTMNLLVGKILFLFFQKMKIYDEIT
jgi:hypothetical protein